MKTSRFLAFFALFALACAAPLPAQEAGRSPAVPFKPALLVIDIQNEFLPMMDQKDVTTGMEAINTLIDLFRANHDPVIRVYHSTIGRGPAPGTEAFEFPGSVRIKDDDAKVVKHYPSAFTKTDLDRILGEKGVKTVFLCGLSATGCVLATYFGAVDREYETIMVKEAVISDNADRTDVIRIITGAMGLKMVGLTLKILSENGDFLETMPNDLLRTSYGIDSPVELNGLGYHLLSKDRPADAIAVFKANVRLFPDEPNGYDSLGEAYERSARTDLALANYEKAYLKAKEKNHPNAAIFEKNYQRLKGSAR